jgi:hypothetical protein
MFEKFGEMESYTELDALAKNLLKEGDRVSLEAMCKENGLDIQDIDDAVADGVELYVTPTMAAMGRIKVQEEESKIPEQPRKIIYDVARMIAAAPENVMKVMGKGKRIDDVWKKLEDMAKKNKTGNVGCACGTDRYLVRLIMEVLA